MSEYYKIIEILNVIRHVDTAFTARHIVSAASSELGSQAHFSTACVSFAAKMSAAKGIEKASRSKGKIRKDPCLAYNVNHGLKKRFMRRFI